jgi:DNA-binding FadR family transcriptional regulator
MKLSDKVIRAIKKDIAAGKLKKNEKIPSEPELMAIYQVGRSTIREAIKTLAISGILKVQQGSGTFVASKLKDESLAQRLRRAEFEDINAVRSLLEIEIVKLACIHGTAKDMEQIYLHLSQRKSAIDAGDQKKCAVADIAFHISIARAAGNPVLLDLYQNFSSVIQTFFTTRDQENRPDSTVANFAHTQPTHEELADAINNRQQELAAHLTKSILHNNY